MAEGDDPEGDPIEAPKYTSPEKREKAKETLTQQEKPEGPATEEQLETIGDGMMMLEEAGKKDELEVVNVYLEESGELTAAQSEELLTIIGDAAGGCGMNYEIRDNKVKLDVAPKRPKKITGTRFAAILGLNPWNTPFE